MKKFLIIFLVLIILGCSESATAPINIIKAPQPTVVEKVYTSTPTSSPVSPTPIPTFTSELDVNLTIPLQLIPTSTPISISIITWNAEEKLLITLINEYRNENNLDDLIYDPILTAKARWLSLDMYQNERFSHIDSLGRDFNVRSLDFGWRKRTHRLENLARGTFSAEQVLQAWKTSEEHNKSLLSSANYVGVSHVEGYWTLELEIK